MCPTKVFEFQATPTDHAIPSQATRDKKDGRIETINEGRRRDGWMDGWVDGWVSGFMDLFMDGWIRMDTNWYPSIGGHGRI